MSVVPRQPSLSDFLLEPLINVMLLYSTEVVGLGSKLLLNADFVETLWVTLELGCVGAALSYLYNFLFHPIGRFCFHNLIFTFSGNFWHRYQLRKECQFLGASIVVGLAWEKIGIECNVFFT